MELTKTRLQCLLRLVKAADEAASFLDDTLGNDEVNATIVEYKAARSEFEKAWRKRSTAR